MVLTDPIHRPYSEPNHIFFHIAIDECRTDDDDCQTLTCQHHGVCRLEFETKPNNKLSSRAYCECPLGFDGQFCETPVEIQASPLYLYFFPF